MKVLTGKTDCKPEEAGYDSARLDTLHKHFARVIDKKIIHGASYCIARGGKIIANGALGAGDSMDHTTQMQPDTVFGIASITKTFTAVAIMQLVEDGFINLSTPVAEILPQFAEKPLDEISIWHLLTHTSGLYPDGGCFLETYPANSWELISRAAKADGADTDWVRAGISAGLRRPIGSEWMYCSFGFALLGEIITRVRGIYAEDYITQRILQPLGMHDSGFSLTPRTAERCYLYDAECADFCKKTIAGEVDGSNNDGGIWEKIPGTAGAMKSTVTDIIRFCNALLNHGRLDGARILGRKSLEKMTTIQLHNKPDFCWNAKEPNRLYGVGFDMRQGPAFTYSPGTFMHEGAGASSVNIDPAEQLAAVWFVPFDSPKNGWSAEPLYQTQNVIWSGLL